MHVRGEDGTVAVYSFRTDSRVRILELQEGPPGRRDRPHHDRADRPPGHSDRAAAGGGHREHVPVR